MTVFSSIQSSARRAHLGRAAGAILMMGAAGLSSAAFAQERVSLVPSIGVASTPRVAVKQQPEPARRAAATTVTPSRSVTTAGVTRWNDIPASRRVLLTQASMDTGGYRLYDTSGATINVPFANQDLHVMKFAVSPDDTTFFVNDGYAPVLYLPVNGCVINDNVPGGRWYPFSARFRPVRPVFLAIAPNYSEYVALQWYPNTITFGGYYGVTSFIDGGVFQPTSGITFYIGTQSYLGWNPYRDYVNANNRRDLRPRTNIRRPRDYARTDPFGRPRRDDYGNGNGGYRNDGYSYPDPYYGGYGRPDNNYPFPVGRGGYSGGGFGVPNGGFGFPGGGFGFPGGGASSGTPAPPRTNGSPFNRVGPSFNRAGPRINDMFGSGPGFGFPPRY